MAPPAVSECNTAVVNTDPGVKQFVRRDEGADYKLNSLRLIVVCYTCDAVILPSQLCYETLNHEHDFQALTSVLKSDMMLL